MNSEPFISLQGVRKVYRSGGAEFLAEVGFFQDDDYEVEAGDQAEGVDGDWPGSVAQRLAEGG